MMILTNLALCKDLLLIWKRITKWEIRLLFYLSGKRSSLIFLIVVLNLSKRVWDTQAIDGISKQSYQKHSS
jgi:hypothetical protein